MQLRDNTVEANSGPDMASYYLYRMISPTERWGLAVEQLEADRFTVAVTLQEPDWPVHGVIRYWPFDTREMAEARFLELQRIMGGLPEDMPMKALRKELPPEERLDDEETPEDA